MTSYRYHRCKSCSVVYSSLTSGYGYGNETHSHSDYCKDCWGVVKDALKGIPTLREKVWIECGPEDPTVDDMIRMRNERIEKARTAQEAMAPAQPAVTMSEPEFVGTMSPRKEIPIRPQKEYTSVNRNTLLTEKLPEGALPIYDQNTSRNYTSFTGCDISSVIKGENVTPARKLTYYVERIGMGMFDLTGKKGSQHVFYNTINGVTYQWSYWTKDEDDREIKKAMEMDTTTGEILGPWKDYR